MGGYGSIHLGMTRPEAFSVVWAMSPCCLSSVDDYRDALRGLRGLGIGVGLSDQFIHIPVGTLEFSQRLGEERIPHFLDVFDGDHRQLVATRLEQVIFPWIGERLAVD